MCFQDKMSAKRSIDRFEAHLSEKEFTQIEGVVHAETFSLIVRIISIYVCFWPCLPFLDFGLFQKDMKTIFLNGHLEEETYMVNLLILYQKDKRTELWSQVVF